MSLPDDLAADLPPPRDDEPATLRRDILDELADHLACALDREQQRQAAIPTTSGESPGRRVLRRFGNPSQIALRLWWDAMQGKIMTQRILLVLTGFVAVACGVAVFAAVRLVAIQERALRAQQEAAAAQQREMTEALRQIAEQSRQAKSDGSIEWVPVSVRLWGPDGKTPAPAGIKVRLRMMDIQNVAPWERVSDGREPVRFPTVRYGQAQLDVESPWSSVRMEILQIPPGAPYEIDVVCPVTPLEEIVIRPELELPEDLRGQGIYCLLPLGAGLRKVGQDFWELRLGTETPAGTPRILVGAGGELHPLDNSRAVDAFLSYDAANVLQGVRWLDRDVVPRWLVQLYIARQDSQRVKEGAPQAADAGSPSVDGPHPPRLFELNVPPQENGFGRGNMVGYSCRFEIRGDDHRAVIRLDDWVYDHLRKAVAELDSPASRGVLAANNRLGLNPASQGPDAQIEGTWATSPKGAFLEPAIPTTRQAPDHPQAE